MTEKVDRAWVQSLLERNRYLILGTTNGRRPWVAPLEYLVDKELNFYFFSPIEVRHVRDLEANDQVAVTVFDSEQGEYSADLSMTLKGVQIEGSAARLDEADYPKSVRDVIQTFKLPMPPYAVYKILPSRFYVPRIENGINLRVEVEVDRAPE